MQIISLSTLIIQYINIVNWGQIFFFYQLIIIENTHWCTFSRVNIIIYVRRMNAPFSNDPDRRIVRTDPETGLMYVPTARGFTLNKKKKFIELAEKYWPNVSIICDIVGISTGVYRSHYHNDPVFHAKVDSFTEHVTDRIEAAMATFALEKSNFMDRIAWLRAHRGEKYNEKKMIQVDVNLTRDKINAKQANLSQAIDTEIVDIELPATNQSNEK